MQVEIQNILGGRVTNSSATVTLSLADNPGSATLSGTVSVAAVNGVATFSNLSLNRPGQGYRLAAASSGLTGATSSTFNVTAGAAVSLRFVDQPGDARAGERHRAGFGGTARCLGESRHRFHGAGGALDGQQPGWRHAQRRCFGQCRGRGRNLYRIESQHGSKWLHAGRGIGRPSERDQQRVRHYRGVTRHARRSSPSREPPVRARRSRPPYRSRCAMHSETW